MLDGQTEKNKRNNERREGCGMTVSVSTASVGVRDIGRRKWNIVGQRVDAIKAWRHFGYCV